MGVEKKHYSLVAAICASQFSTPLMMAGVNAILPELGQALHATAAQLGLVGGAYALGLAVFQLACGSFGDISGHKRLFLCGAGIFCVSGVVLGCLDSINIFLMFRFIQGCGGAMIAASGLALLASCAPQEKRTVYLGFSSTAVYAGIACGAPIAGLIAGSIGWRWLFWINALATFVIMLLMKLAVKHDWQPAQGKCFDWMGCVYYGISMCALTVASSRIPSSNGWILVFCFIIFFGIFIRHELKSTFPILNFNLLAENRVLTLSSLAAFINYASFFGMVFYFSVYLQVGKGLSVRESGLILAIQPLAQTLCTPLATRLCSIWGEYIISAIGAAICGLGLVAAAMLNIETSLAWLFLAQCLIGSGISMFSLSNTSIILGSAGRAQVGMASSLTGAMRTAGQLVSMIIITCTLSLFLGKEAISLAKMPAFMTSMRINLILFGFLNILAIGMSLARNKAVK